MLLSVQAYYTPMKIEVLNLKRGGFCGMQTNKEQLLRKLKHFHIAFDLCSDEKFEAVFLLADFRKSIK
jgi:hypothetical protein